MKVKLMPDATFDWDAEEAKARSLHARLMPPSMLSGYLMGWNAAMAWVKMTAALQEVGGRVVRRAPHKRPLDVVCSHCSAGRGAPCKTASGKTTSPHRNRRVRSSQLRARTHG